MKKNFLILTINPGSTSTKVGVYKNEKVVFESTVRHSVKMLEQFKDIWDQYNFRKEEIIDSLENNDIRLSELDAVVGRGGVFKPVPSGTYVIDEAMIEDARLGKRGKHASNLACVIAYSIGWEYNIPSYIVDPPSVDELEPLARISGHADIERRSLFHALNIFATARKFSVEKNKKLSELNLIVAHLGGGITVAALKNGKAINVNSGYDEGPFTPERTGELPVISVIEKCFSGKYTQEQLTKIVFGKGGLTTYFNTNKASDVENMIKAGSEKFRLVYEAMAYQIAEEIGRRATNLLGKVDAIILTGGIAHSEMLTKWIIDRVKFISQVYKYPGELELEALALGGLRVLKGEEVAKQYKQTFKKVGVIYWEAFEGYTRGVKILEEIFKANGYTFRTDNNNIEIIYNNCRSNEDIAKKAIENYIDEDVDIIFAIGSPAALSVKQFLTSSSIPVVCIGLYSQNTMGDVSWWDKNENYYASCYGTFIKQQIENSILKISPKIKKIGLMYKIGEVQSEIQHDEIQQYCKEVGMELFSINIESSADFTKAYDYFNKNNVEWLILGSDVTVSMSTKAELDVLTLKMPTMCIMEDTINIGGLIGYIVSWDNVCKTAVEVGLKLLGGETVETRIMQSELRRLISNKSTAEKLGFLKEISLLSNIELL